MALNPRRVLPGDPLDIPANVWNQLIGLLGTQAPELSGPLESAVRPVVTVWVKNNTGTDLPARSVVKLSTVLVDPVTLPLDFQARPVYGAVSPAVSTDAFVVLLEPVKSAEIGRAAALGVVVVDVNVTSVGHLYAAPGTLTTRLESATCGPAKILTRESGTGVKRATVLL